jgi:uncharacterized cupin superfamily protein
MTMSRGLIEIGKTNVELTPRPIEPSWIIEGKPEATWCVLSKSADGLASTMVWHCTEGKFNWYYDFDETIMILEGSIVLENDSMRPTRYSAGDVIFFRDGAHARWHVEGHVKKLAFLPQDPAGMAWLRVARGGQAQAHDDAGVYRRACQPDGFGLEHGHAGTTVTGGLLSPKAIT